ncbi:glycosyltransferase family 9 protein [Streptomyces hebeiensis]|uniref:Glycosyltransferase family 9 protein n=1 Tax=Streptomyces hebeiensis TaxID=229486 RepID=A0ABP4FCX1_9ACTN
MSGHVTSRRRPRVLVLRALGLGDLLAGVPALRGVRRAFPGHEIVLAAPASLYDAARATGAVDTLLPTRASGRAVPSLRHWTGDPPEVAVDLHGNGPESRDALAELRPGRLLAFAAPGERGEPPPEWRADEHERDRWCRFLRAYGIPADPADLRLAPPLRPSAAAGAVVVHPGADSAARRWPADRYAEVVAGLVAAGVRTVLTGGPGEDGLLAGIADSAGLDRCDVRCGGLPFEEFSALIARAAVFVSGDTGPAHLAVALGTSSVTLFGPVPPRLWGPPPDERHVVLWHPGPPGDPHATVPDPLLSRIRAAEVHAAVGRLLDHRAGQGGTPRHGASGGGASGGDTSRGDTSRGGASGGGTSRTRTAPGAAEVLGRVR